MRTNLPD